MATPPISVEVNAAQVLKFRKRVERWQGAPLAKRASMGTLKAGDYMKPVIQRGIPRSKSSRGFQAIKRSVPGTLRRSVKVRKGRRGAFTDAYVGPTAPHKFFFIKGTNPHALGSNAGVVGTRAGRGDYVVFGPNQVRAAGSVIHPGADSHPVVDEAAQRHANDAIRIINEMLFSETS